MTEAIIDQEDRELNSSLGNWTGEVQWEAGPIKGREGLMWFQCPVTQEIIHGYLDYPNFKVEPSVILTLTFLLTQAEAPTPGTDSDWYLYDGVNTVEAFEDIIEYIGEWMKRTVSFNIPAEWIKDDGQLILWIKNTGVAEKNFYIDNLSGQYEVPPVPTHKIQYLPLVGVG